METISVKGFSFAYPGEARSALSDIDLAVKKGEFFVLCGPSGSGKSTLLRQFCTAMTPHGTCTGEVFFEGAPLASIDHRSQSMRIGFVQQSPDRQIVTDRVWHELAFGAESLGMDKETMRRRIAEMVSFFGIGHLVFREVNLLSGGQKQLVNLASVMVMRPELLVLDEPTGQLDPIAASSFLSMLSRINREFGTTVILSEHRLDEALPLADRMAVLDGGRLLCVGSPREVCLQLKDLTHPMFASMPAPIRIWYGVGEASDCPITVREGADWLTQYAAEHTLTPSFHREPRSLEEDWVLKAEDLSFRYDKNADDIVKGLSFTVRGGQLYTLLGENGCGKTTVLRLCAGLLRPDSGSVQRVGRIAYLPQEPMALFTQKTVYGELSEMVDSDPAHRDAQLDAVLQMAEKCRLQTLLDRHPNDLSGGEQQRVAFAKLLITQPDLLLLDEPTKGLDADAKQDLAIMLEAFLADGHAVLIVSHDIEFCASYADACGLLFAGSIAAEGTPRDFFSGNAFYTTQSNRMARTHLPNAITAEDVILSCGGTVVDPKMQKPIPKQTKVEMPALCAAEKRGSMRLPMWRRIGTVVSVLGAFFLVLYFTTLADLQAWADIENLRTNTGTPVWLYAALIACLLAAAFFAAPITGRRGEVMLRPLAKPRLRIRDAVVLLLLCAAIPAVILLGAALLDESHYMVLSVIVLFLCMLPFLFVFEKRRPLARELVTIAVLCAIAVAGRAVFFMIPHFKPVMAIVIIAGAALGSETGFFVGAVTMLISNMMFSQGPWTPWQMFCMGLIGFLAGLLYRRLGIARSRISLCIFGAVSCILLYGGIMNSAAALMWSQHITPQILLSYCLIGLPMDCVHAAATALFLWFAGDSMLQKLDRICEKYGLMR